MSAGIEWLQKRVDRLTREADRAEKNAERHREVRRAVDDWLAAAERHEQSAAAALNAAIDALNKAAAEPEPDPNPDELKAYRGEA